MSYKYGPGNPTQVFFFLCRPHFCLVSEANICTLWLAKVLLAPHCNLHMSSIDDIQNLEGHASIGQGPFRLFLTSWLVIGLDPKWSLSQFISEPYI